MAYYRNTSTQRVNLSYLGITRPFFLEAGDIIDLPSNIRERTVQNTCPQLKIINFRPQATGLKGVKPYTLGEAKTFYWMRIK